VVTCDQCTNFLAIGKPFWPLQGTIRVPSGTLGPHIKISGFWPLLLKQANRRPTVSHIARAKTPLSELRGWNEGKSKLERPGQPKKSNRGTGGKAALQQVITQTASYPYHNPNKTNIMVLTRLSTICGCEESWITASYCTAGRQGSHVPNRQVMSLQARPLSHIRENANSCIKLSFGNGYFFFCFSVHIRAIPIYYFSYLWLSHSFLYNLMGTQLRGCVGILYIIQSSFPFPFLTLLFTTV
jgi:hypothetical protein